MLFVTVVKTRRSALIHFNLAKPAVVDAFGKSFRAKGVSLTWLA
jgi:hypothetical protein